MNSITREDWWLEKPENTSLKENIKKKEKEYEARKVSWSGTQVGQEVYRELTAVKYTEVSHMKKERSNRDLTVARHINNPTHNRRA